jgi:hypothetical protein
MGKENPFGKMDEKVWQFEIMFKERSSGKRIVFG